jgi:peptide-methionine (S)-S-oxide reductase
VRATLTARFVELGWEGMAEEYHQEYLAKNPGSYCGLGGTDVAFPE